MGKQIKKPNFIYDIKTYPKNADQWWSMLDQTWNQLLPILTEFIPIDKINTINDYKNDHNVKLVEYLELCYDKVPHVDCQRIIGWSILCELLSESDVLRIDYNSDMPEL